MVPALQGSGNLDREEIVTLIDFFSDKPMTDPEVDAAMKAMDEDNSGAASTIAVTMPAVLHTVV